METDIPLGTFLDFLPLFSPDNQINLGIETWVALGIIVLLLCCSALLSGSEVAYFSITHNDLHDDSNKKKRPGKAKGRILNLLERPHYLLSTILIGNNFVNIGIILTSNFFFSQILVLPTSWEPWIRNAVSTGVTVVLVTFLLVLFGEVAPKVYASSNNIRLASFMSRPLLLMRRLFSPLSWVLVNSTRVIEKRLQKRMKNGSLNVVSDKDIEQAIELTVGDTKYAEQDIGLLKSIVKFGNTTVKNIMRARVDVISIDKEIPFRELIDTLRECNYSRVPVYEESFDHVLGIIHSKDLIEHSHKDNNFNWHTLLRTAFFVPEGKKIDDLFAEFQTRRTHMAIVVDEYGGTSGLVTLEDVLEEIVGEINDEFDEPDDVGYTKISDSIFLFEGRTSLSDVTRILNIDSHTFDEGRGAAETIAGLILVLSGVMPKKNTRLNYKGMELMVVNSSERRIETVKVTLKSVETNS